MIEISPGTLKALCRPCTKCGSYLHRIEQPFLGYTRSRCNGCGSFVKA